jgi:16S rRNA (cytosine967-C5)-methyltransferase
LVVAAYQIRLLDRVPTHAAVDAAVSEVRGQRGPKVAGFVNAVLRKLGALTQPLSLQDAVERSAPDWLLRRLREAVGPEEARALLGAAAAPNSASLRLVSGSPPVEWLEQLGSGRASPRARLVQSGGDLRTKAGYADGAYVIQEEGAQVVGLCLGAKPGERVLDACAGRGQKSSLLAEQIAPQGELWAADLHPHKLRALDAECERLGLLPPTTAGVDWTKGCGDVPVEYFDRVLVDAPCSGTGTLRRRPEIGMRLRPEDPARLAELAEKILRSAARCARPGGRVVFAVCSVLPEECEGLADRVQDVLSPTPFDSEEATAIAGAAACFLRLLPLAHGTEGYYVASFSRR